MVISNDEKTAIIYIDRDGNQVGIDDYLGLIGITKNLSDNNGMGAKIHLVHTSEKKNIKTGMFELVSNYFEEYASELFNKNRISSILNGHEYYYKEEYTNDLINYLKNEAKNILKNSEETYEHDFLGLKEFEGKKYFFGEKVLLDGGNESVCIRDGVKFTSGNEKTYFDMLEKYVYPRTELSVAFAIGLSAIVNSILFNRTSLGVPIYVFSGQSSTGKTLAASLAISAFMDCNQVSSKLMIRLNSTKLALTNQLKGINGFPVCLDDAVNVYQGDITELIYTFASGSPRTTSSPSNKTIYHEGWTGTIIITAETNILENSTKKSGEDVRVIDFNSVKWTSDRDSCDEIRDIISANYGFVGTKLGEYICSLGNEKVYEDFLHFEKIINKLQEVHKDNLSYRIGDKYASIALSAYYYNKFFGNKLDVKKIIDFILGNEIKLVKNRDKAFQSYEAVFNHYIKFRNSFNKDGIQSKGLHLGNERWGNSKTDPNVYVMVPLSELKDILQRNGFLQYKNYIHEWISRGYIQVHGDNNGQGNTKSIGRYYTFVFSQSAVRIALGFEQEKVNEMNPVKTETPHINFDLDDTEAVNKIFAEKSSSQESTESRIIENIENTPSNIDFYIDSCDDTYFDDDVDYSKIDVGYEAFENICYDDDFECPHIDPLGYEAFENIVYDDFECPDIEELDNIDRNYIFENNIDGGICNE